MKSTHKPWLRRIGLVTALLAAFFIGLSLRGAAPTETEPTADAATQATTWTCSMHPQFQLPEPGLCPLCAMELIPVESGTPGEGDSRSLTLTASARKLAAIQTAPVEHRRVYRTLRIAGQLETAESRIREVAARVAGRIDRLHVDASGVPVRAGQKLFDLYSPELYSAQVELLQTVRSARELGASSLESSRRSAARTVDAARERLRLWGLTARQIQQIEAQPTPTDHLTITAPVSGVVLAKSAVEGSYVKAGQRIYTIGDLSDLWLILNVYEADLAWLATGQEVEFRTRTFGDETFTGTVSFIDPVLDERSRSVEVRVEVDNADQRLKPGMFARAVVLAEVNGEDGGLPLVVPETAPLVTGKRAIVYVADSDMAGEYHGRDVELGAKADGYYVVRDGLAEGELVVTHGAFKIDSALQILARPSMMSPGNDGSAPVHDQEVAPETEVTQITDVPLEFRLQLDPVLGLYFDVSTALSRDDLVAAAAAARQLPDALADPAPELLPPAGRDAWSGAGPALARSARAVATAGNITVARQAFYDLSNVLIATVKQLGASGKRPVMVFHCPMANENRGADWLQASEDVQNPYYGSQMYRCGAKSETLVAGAAATATNPHQH